MVMLTDSLEISLAQYAGKRHQIKQIFLISAYELLLDKDKTEIL